MGVVRNSLSLTQADEASQAEFQKKYGFVKKPINPRKISSVSSECCSM